MASSVTSTRGLAVTPHQLATQSAMTVLRDGGTAVEAAVAAAATIAVVYPHMNSIGGDSFWLIIPPRGDPLVIEACGVAGSQANLEFYEGFDEIPIRGPKAANTVAGTVGGWQEALDYVSECGYQRKSISKLLADAIYYANHGFPISTSQEADLKEVKNEGWLSSEFKKNFLPNGTMPKTGEIFCQKKLAETLKHLVENGLTSFYRGKLAKKIVKGMKEVGMPITEEDLANYAPIRKRPLRLLHKYGELLNVPPPTQGLVSLSILGILDKLNIDGKNEGEFIHTTVEATKQAFDMRDEYISDPICMKIDPNFLLSDKVITAMANNIGPKARSLRNVVGPGDTVWLGVMDDKGFSVSFIQSTYSTFGSGVVIPETGILWHNRGISFTLAKDHIRSLKPGKKPFHTLNPAAARLNDGRVIIYGTRGGDGQPQTQAAIFHRYVIQNVPLQKSVSDPRWLYGNTIGINDDSLKLEDRFDEKTIKYLKDRGHKVVILPPYSACVGFAGILVRHSNGVMEGAYDPRSNGSAAGF
ncbi:uncharacterized protein LOC113231806 [Hyposmocoma kahamanoa]|uniref:uncharacterized protein LOC113231806 n=1 Tax=Hyposmocoma kahamanoa TaxID=1477025 RepID=UPI000E6D6883|nr:uncharacterized protein LOC113231806 [Hyposmocoma kahamanoa]XP_026322126.1 uncharacterized protein LOC113231806 [Hyposmocoma kahamanoa]